MRSDERVYNHLSFVKAFGVYTICFGEPEGFAQSFNFVQRNDASVTRAWGLVYTKPLSTKQLSPLFEDLNFVVSLVSEPITKFLQDPIQLSEGDTSFSLPNLPRVSAQPLTNGINLFLRAGPTLSFSAP